MPLVKILLRHATEEPPEAVPAWGALVDRGLWGDFHLGRVREEGEGGLGALLRPVGADVALSAVAVPHRVSVQRAFVAIQPGNK